MRLHLRWLVTALLATLCMTVGAAGDLPRAAREAFELGDPRSQLRLGILYDMGHGTSRNLWEAARWYRAAEEQCDAQAQYNICVLLFNGDGGLRDLGEARKWCAKAAEQGDQAAQRLLRRIEGPGAWPRQPIGPVMPGTHPLGVAPQTCLPATSPCPHQRESLRMGARVSSASRTLASG